MVVSLSDVGFTAGELLERLAPLSTTFGGSLRASWVMRGSLTGPEAEEIVVGVRDSRPRRWSDDQRGCAGIEVVDDGAHLLIRSEDTFDPRAHWTRFALHRPDDAVYAMQWAELEGLNLATEEAHWDASCQGDAGDAACTDALAAGLDRALQIGVPCEAARLHVGRDLAWPRLSALLDGMIAMGVDKVHVRAFDEAGLRSVIDAYAGSRILDPTTATR
ncbi:MAG: hypothetical protein R3B09_12805 [Nannocystaceae bacterium]